jgi:porin
MFSQKKTILTVCLPGLMALNCLAMPCTANADSSATQTPGAPTPQHGDTGIPAEIRSATQPAPPATDQAQDTPPDFSDTLTGDWGGLRNRLAYDGLTFTGVYHADFWRNVTGGLHIGNAFLDDLDLQVSGDGEKLYGLPGSSFFIYGLNNDGGKVNAHLVGSNGGIDNIEVTHDRPKLYEAWIQQNFFDDRLSLLGGLYDENTEFYVTSASQLFLNPAYGVGTELGDTGPAGPSIFPQTSAGARILVKPAGDTYVETAALGGHPADPGDPNGLRAGFGPNAGLLLLGEAGYKNDDNGHYAVGAWHYTTGFDDYNSDSDTSRKGDSGTYGLAERKLLQDPANKDRTLSGFVRLGFADKSVSPYVYSWSAGVSVNNVVSSRKDSQAGFAVSQARISGDYRQQLINSGTTAGTTETQFELTYADKPMAWLTVQPDLQYTIHPAAIAGRSDALTAGIRGAVNF